MIKGAEHKEECIAEAYCLIYIFFDLLANAVN